MTVRRKSSAVSVLVVLAATAVAPFAAGGIGSSEATGTLDLRASLRIQSVRGANCPPGSSASTECATRTGTGVVSGLGSVTESYTYVVAVTHPSCPDGNVKVLGYPTSWTVAAKGEIRFVVATSPDCLSPLAGLNATQSFTITGGTGIYTGASGSGSVTRLLGQTDTGAAGTETWTSTLNVAGLEFDVTAPTIRGATSKTVRAPKRATRVRVTYAVTASDNVDGSVPVQCRPASGSRFKVGRTVVRCSATDASGNAATATFRVTVKRTR